MKSYQICLFSLINLQGNAGCFPRKIFFFRFWPQLCVLTRDVRYQLFADLRCTDIVRFLICRHFRLRFQPIPIYMQPFAVNDSSDSRIRGETHFEFSLSEENPITVDINFLPISDIFRFQYQPNIRSRLSPKSR